MTDQIAQLKEQLQADVQKVQSSSELEEFRIKYLARRGQIAQLFDRLKALSPGERPAVGKALNELRSFAQSKFDERKTSLEQVGERLGSHLVLTLPGRPQW